MEKKQPPPTSIRMSQETRAMLDEMAAEEIRTISNFIEFHIRRMYAERKSKKDVDSQM